MGERANRSPKSIDMLYNSKDIIPESTLGFLQRRVGEISDLSGTDLGRRESLAVEKAVAMWILLDGDPEEVDREALIEINGIKLRGSRIKQLYRNYIFHLDVEKYDYLREELVPSLVPEILEHMRSLSEEERNNFLSPNLAPKIEHGTRSGSIRAYNRHVFHPRRVK